MQPDKCCDIVIPVWNEYKLTKTCIESIRKNTDFPYRIIAVDNGSDSETKGYLESCKSSDPANFALVRNEENLGFVKASNQGMRLSNAKYVCLLNNDTIVGEKWLGIMINVLENNSSIGLLNPLSNTFGRGPKDIIDIDDYSRKIALKKDRFVEAGQCIGFCMLMRRGVIDRIGHLSENSTFMFFEDTDYSIRARNMGFICAIAMGAYVYHYEHKSGDKLGSKQGEIFQENQKLFYKKWGEPLRIVYVSSVDPKTSRELLKRNIGEAISISKKGNYVYIFQRGKFKGDIDDFYESLGLVRFLNAQIFFKDKSFKLYCIYRILTRRKKRFDAIFANDSDFYSLLKKIFFFHRIAIYRNLNEADAVNLWSKRHKNARSVE
ncbi:MAG: hypothetical protein COS99_07120 [Candidatus Omnitrophica bacterium CG07_land_8_20_14_0_80_42_15]|uniref:Glycosyltransferase 2-like domain-containing protein n=1 Tax=Candidatus Aquitaenariimonas noxiae TaxID=1974741 RepID=A0A2J0KXE4_9BACT|nr:MAG: hypothetical protein COS99_07120 [Candidatus Omnitrophica bacterium CG07_land_8_20_14_0_80_42_15]